MTVPEWGMECDLNGFQSIRYVNGHVDILYSYDVSFAVQYTSMSIGYCDWPNFLYDVYVCRIVYFSTSHVWTCELSTQCFKFLHCVDIFCSQVHTSYVTQNHRNVINNTLPCKASNFIQKLLGPIDILKIRHKYL